MTTNITLEASNFKTTPSDLDSHATTDWQIAEDSGFSSIVESSMADPANLVSWTPEVDLESETTYYARVRYSGSSSEIPSSWSETAIFKTADTYIETPTNVSPVDNATDVEEQPTLEASAFTTTNDSERACQ